MDFCRWLAAEANQPTIKTVCKQRLGIKLILMTSRVHYVLLMTFITSNA